MKTPTFTAGSREDWVERVRAATDIVELVGQTVALRRTGRNWMGRCPFHEEKTPSFSVHAERQFYHCFSCKAGGDVFKFVQEIEKVGFLEAVELLSRRAGIPVPERRGPEETGRRARLLEALDQAARAYEQWLADPERGAATRAYLERRGIERDTLRAFRLGLAPAGWENLVQRLAGKLGEETLVEAGLAARRDEARGGGARGIYDRFRNRLMVPLIAPGGAVVGFGARALADEDPPKYLNSPETPVYHKGSFLFGLEQARRPAADEGEFVLVEGYFDAIAMHQAGIAHAVATSGTALTPEQAKLVRRVAPRVAFAYDGDAAGQDAMMRSLGVLLAEGLEVAIVELPSGSDPDTLVRAEGAPGWRARRSAAYDAVTFVQRHVLRTAKSGDPLERALQAVVDLVAPMEDEIRRRLLLERANQVFGFSVEVLERAAALKRRGQRSPEPIAAAVRARRSAASSLERRLLAALLMAPDEIEYAKGELSPADFGDGECAALAAYLWEHAAPPSEPEAIAVLARELTATHEESVAWAVEAQMKTLQLATLRLQREMRALEERQRHAPQPESDQIAAQIHAVSARLLAREELWKRLQRQRPALAEESDPARIMSELNEIAARHTGPSNPGGDREIHGDRHES